MKILVIGQEFPWPPTSGSPMRLIEVIKAASEIGETDFFSFVRRDRAEPCEVPTGIPIRRAEIIRTQRPDYSAQRRAKWMLSPGIPLEVAAASFGDLADPFAKWSDDKYDVIWFSKPLTYVLLGRPSLGPTIVDLDDLEDRKIDARLDRMRSQRQHRSMGHELGARSQARINSSRWRALQFSVSDSVERVVLCSDLDAARFARRNVSIIPNGYERPKEHAGGAEVGVPPTILLQGSLEYGPNADAARWLVEDIAPLVRREIPNARVRLVGKPDRSVERLQRPGEVDVVGLVPSMLPELATADLVAVPLRYGSGTRIKILEAFAHRIPVVSTPLGAEGLGAIPGIHLLEADNAQAFAARCVQALRDIDLRKRLSEAAEDLYLSNFQWSSIGERIKELFKETSVS